MRKLRLGLLAAVILGLVLSLSPTRPAVADLPEFPDGYPTMGSRSEDQPGLPVEMDSGRMGTTLFPIEVGPGATEYAYCIEAEVSAQWDIDVTVGAWENFPGTNEFATDPQARQKIAWIVYNSFPHLNIDAYRAALGQPDLTEEEAIAGTQASIWTFSDGLTYEGLASADPASPEAARVQAVVDHLTGSANVGRAETVGPEVAVQMPTGEQQAGSLVGPIRITASEATVAVTVTGGHPLVTADGRPVDLAAVPTGVDLFFNVPVDAPAGSATVDAVVTGPSSTGLLVSNTDPRTQTLMIARSDQATANANGEVTWIAQPRITTSAADAADDDEHLAPTGEVTVVDTVTYAGLVPGKTYTISGELMTRSEDGEAINTGITATKEFTPDATNGTVELEFSIPAGDLVGEVIVVFEKLFLGKTQVAIHADIDDEDQTVYRPKIGTTAVDGVDGDNLLPETGEATVVDTVAYSGLKVGQSYTLRGVLMTKDADGVGVETDITQEVTFTPEASSGSVKLTFTIPAGELRGQTVVVFERLFVDDKEVTVHTDIEDDDQTVYRPRIGTTAVDGEDGNKYLPSQGEATVVDTVSYAGLEPGKEYTISGELMTKDADGEPVATGITATHTFVPASPTGSVELTFTIAEDELLGETIVVFEKLLRGDAEVAVHADIDDEGQTVHRPRIGTSAMDAADNDQFLAQTGPVTVVDTVSYEGLRVGQSYTVNGELMTRTADGPQASGITAQVTFVPETPDGTVELSFTLADDQLRGSVIVVFERLSVDGTEVATHADINDEEQTVYRPLIDTDAYDLSDGDQMLAPEGGTLRDDVAYSGLQIGRTYIVRGEVLLHDTGETTGLTGETTFVAQQSDGIVHVDIAIPNTYATKTLVVFEWLYLVPEEDADSAPRALGDVTSPSTEKAGELLLAIHTDLKAERQTVRVDTPPPPPLADTGAAPMLAAGAGLGGILLLAGAGLVVAALRRRRI